MHTASASFRERTIGQDEVLRVVGYNPYYHAINGGLGDPLYVNGKRSINLASNNYLGLANDDRIKETYINAIRKYGVSMCATPVAGGYTDQFQSLQAKLSKFIHVESILLYPSCYQANNGIFSAVVRKDDLVLFDRGAHSSLIQGIWAVGCRALPFAHNDMESLEWLLNKKRGYAHVFVVTESVFSTEGAIAPFSDIYRLCKTYGATPVVDDSHGIGVLGENGGGILEHCGIQEYDGIYTTSLGKAMANNCGVVGGPQHLINYLQYFSSHLVYSTAIAPCVLAGISRTLDIIANEYPERIERVYYYHHRIKMELKNAGFMVVDSQAPINSIKGGSSEDTITLAKKLYDHGIECTPFVYPSVPKNEGRVRLIAGANLKEETISLAINIFRNVSPVSYELLPCH